MNIRTRALPRVRVAIIAGTLLCMTGLATPTLAARQTTNASDLGRFMWGLAGQESGWNYYARNTYSGAFGRYQIMPANWASWSRRYLDSGWHDQNALNQELVARAKVSGLHHWLGSWPRVAYWWLSGNTDPNRSHWSSVARRYVDNVLSLMSRAPARLTSLPADPADATGMPVNQGDWRLVLHRAHVRDLPGGAHSARSHVRQGDVLRVRRTQWGPKGHVLWLRVRAKDGTLGWINAKTTVPAAAR